MLPSPDVQTIRIADLPIEPFGTFAMSPVRRSIWQQKDLLMGTPGGKLFRSLMYKIARLGWEGPMDLVNSHGIRCRIRFRDNITDFNCFRRGVEFERDFCAAIDLALRDFKVDDPFLYLDIGANTGLLAATALGFAKRHGTEMHVIAVEPQTEIIPRLIANLSFAETDIGHPVFNCALGAEVGSASLRVKAQSVGQSMIVEDDASALKVPIVPLQSILDACDCKRIDFMKIDVEGYEYTILKPFFDTTDRNMWPKSIFCETNDTGSEQLVSYILSLGYSIRSRGVADTFFAAPELS